MQIFDQVATRTALPFDRLLEALHEMFTSHCIVPERHSHEISARGSGGVVTSLIMPAWMPGKYYGVKTTNIAAGNASLGLPGLHATYLLYDANTGVPLALIDGDELTSRRTAAASALAASRLARADARHLLVVGAGRIARLLPEAYRSVLPVEKVTVWARVPQRAEAMATTLKNAGFDATATSDLAAAAGEADIVSCATPATEPLIRGEWLRPGTHLDLIGSFAPHMREADDACFADASLWVDTFDAILNSGELRSPMSRSVFAPEDVCGTLVELSRADAPVRTSPAERTVFKAVGDALEDLAAAILVYESATGHAS